MIRSALILCAGIIVATCFACAPPPPPPPTIAGSRSVSATCSSDGSSFLNHVQVLSTTFVPGHGATPPTINGLSSSSTYAAGLTAAFNAASPAFQQQLCSLNGIYIVPACQPGSGCTDYSNSWGWRRRVGAARESYIGISAGFWSVANYSSYETTLLNTVLPPSGATYSGATYCSAPGSCTSVDTFATALLAAMAHEVGHVLWYVLVDPRFPDTQQIALNCPDGGSFFGGSWQSVHHPPKGHGGEWRDLSTPGSRKGSKAVSDMHRYPPQISQIDAAAGTQGLTQLIAQLLAQGQPWASGFAAVSPDEDFVETYKFQVLMTANLLFPTLNTPLNSVTLTIPTTPPTSYNIPQDYFQTLTGAASSRPELVRKVGCITAALNSLGHRI